MFVALDSSGRQRLSFEEDKQDLRKLSKSKGLRCPYCERLVIFHGGSRRIHHFNHEPHVECTFTGEPETQEHLNGKWLIYDWLKKKYPQAEVSLEKRIIETNQIADVYADFGEGRRFAFEIQCAELTTEEWLQRRKLYREANIRDIWLFGMKYYKEIDEEELYDGETVLRLKYLQQVVNTKERSVYFIDSVNSEVRQIGDFFYLSVYSETRVLAKVQVMSLNDLRIIKVQSPCQYLLADLKTIKKIEFYFNQRNQEAKRIWNERAFEKREVEERLRQYEHYQWYLNNFCLEDAYRQMSEREEIIFKQLVKEYGFTNDNFPGIFNVQLENHHFIQTPYPLWQLLVFHKALKHNTSNKKLIFPPHFFQDIKTKLRYEVKNSKYAAGLIYEYLEVLEHCGFISNKFYYREYKHPFAIENSLLSKMEGKKQNGLLALYYSKFNNEESEEDDNPLNLISEEQQVEMKKVSEYYRYLVISQID
ncbi:competence protein CoiA [Planococcus glaciei]|uniref:competence protein CoiA n=1 Tax=Planococcus glaciei TaxID=459472 RepID=UPI001C72CE0B|nr:competence protein CoiA family protein [Planococcus glaciei]MBX0313299.1 competence protein CoiA [Planococcus glaciei]